jgi:hypothetical protein
VLHAGQTRSASAALRAAVVAVCALAAAPLAAPEAQEGRQPWDLPRGSSARSLPSDCDPSSYATNYESAKEALQSGRAARSDRDLAWVIVRLQCAIAREAEPGVKGGRTSVEYYPYFWLAKAFELKRDYESALRCVQKEGEYPAIARSSLAAEFDGKRGELQARADAEVFVRLAQRVEQWQQGQGAVRLSSAGAQKAAEVARTRQELEAGAAGQVKPAQDRLGTTLRALVVDEMGTVNKRLGALDWATALGGKEPKLDEASCAVPSAAWTARTLPTELDELERCSGAAVSALRQAGALGCRQLERLRGEAEESRRRLAELGQSAGAVPELPGVCAGAAWDGADLARLGSLLDELSFVERRAALESARGSADAAIARVLGERMGEQERALATILTVPAACARGLGVASVNEQLDKLGREIRGAVSAGRVVEPPHDRIRQLHDELASRADVSVQKLLGDKCADATERAFAELSEARARFAQTRGQDQLRGLCEALLAADRSVAACWSKREGELRPKLPVYRRFLEVAAEWRLPGSGDAAGLSCLSDQLAAVRRQESAPGGGSWSQQTRDVIADAGACLADHRAAQASWVAGLARTVDGAMQAMPEGAGGRVQEVRQELSAVKTRLDSLLPLFDAALEPSEPRLRENLGRAGLSDGVGWGELAALREVDAHAAFATLRDEVARVELERLAGTLESRAPVIGRLVVFDALDRAYAAFGRGDLDEAIRALHEGGVSVPGPGDAAALHHAALSYFLYLKGLTHGGTPVAALLEQDAVREAEAAVRASAAFDLPERLFESQGYRDFFESCRRNVGG